MNDSLDLLEDLTKIDSYVAYEGQGTLFDVDPVHSPKIAKAKKGWL
jgi:hypothetical protein